MSQPCLKVKYRSQKQALVANSRTRRRWGAMEPYYCEKCEGWHLGHELGSWAAA